MPGREAASLSSNKSMTDLIDALAVTPIRNEMPGQFDPPSTSQVDVAKVSTVREHFTPIGHRDRDVPYDGAALQMHGNIGLAPMRDLWLPVRRAILVAVPRSRVTTSEFVGLDDLARNRRAHTALVPRLQHVIEKFLSAGDACISAYHTLHSATCNERRHESRKNVMFGIRNKGSSEQAPRAARSRRSAERSSHFPCIPRRENGGASGQSEGGRHTGSSA